MKNFDEIKKTATSIKHVYYLKNATVYVSSDGYHFTKDLDPIESIVESVEKNVLDENKSNYIEFSLQYNMSRFQSQAELVKRYSNNSIGRVLDIGCGGGLFLYLLKQEGAEVVGLELDEARIQFAKKKYGINIIKKTIENQLLQASYANYFDIVTLWDVIEHVNFPLATLAAAVNVLKPGGYLMVDTPCRDSFYHRVGELTYHVSGGHFPTFLNIMYSRHKFGHKQIFSTQILHFRF